MGSGVKQEKKMVEDSFNDLTKTIFRYYAIK